MLTPQIWEPIRTESPSAATAMEDAVNPIASPLLAKDLSGFPKNLIITADLDPLRDDGADYATALRKAGVPTTHSNYNGVIHGFFNMWTAVDDSKKAFAEATKALKSAFRN